MQEDLDDARALIRGSLDATAATVEHLRALAPEIAAAAGLILDCLAAGGKVLTCGNGGSAADAQHLASELVGRFGSDRPPLAAIALSTDTSSLTAIANDHGYDQVFRRQLLALGSPGDVLVVISTSGASPNILTVARAAREAGVTVLGMTGQNGHALTSLCDCCLTVPSGETPRIQEGHAVLVHLLCELVERALADEANASGA